MLGQITKDQRQKSQSGTLAGGERRGGPHGLILLNLVNNTRSSQAKYRLSSQYLTFYSLWPKIQPPFHFFFPSKTCWYCFHCFWMARTKIGAGTKTSHYKDSEDCCWKVLLNLHQEVFRRQPGIVLKKQASVWGTLVDLITRRCNVTKRNRLAKQRVKSKSRLCPGWNSNHNIYVPITLLDFDQLNVSELGRTWRHRLCRHMKELLSESP